MSDIAAFFADKVVLLTGGTGFVGKVTMERLLRVCGVQTLYVLVRGKRDRSAAERFAALFDADLFDRLRAERPDFGARVHLIAGDCLAAELGVSAERWAQLHAEVQVVINCAATVRFYEGLRTAYCVNVRAPWDLLVHARRMRHLRCFVHVSTAFAHAELAVVEERAYDAPITGEQLRALLEAFEDDAVVKRLEPAIFGSVHNSYTYTKAVAEHVVAQLATDAAHPLPVAILRPSIIVSTYRDPLPGWTDNPYGPIGITVAVAMGFLRSLHGSSRNRGDMVPVDYVASALLAVAYDTARKEDARRAQAADGRDAGANFDVVNYTSGEHSISWGAYMDIHQATGVAMPLQSNMWKPVLFFHRHLLLDNISCFLLHTVPAYLVDTVLLVMGRRPVLVAGYRKFEKFRKIICTFISREWDMPHRKILALFERLNAVDRQLFELRISTFKWDAFSEDYLKGCRLYITKEPLSNLPEARRRYRKILAAYYTVNGVLLLLAGVAINRMLSLVGCNIM